MSHVVSTGQTDHVGICLCRQMTSHISHMEKISQGNKAYINAFNILVTSQNIYNNLMQNILIQIKCIFLNDSRYGN